VAEPQPALLWSKLFIPTLREEPAESSNPSHRLLIRAGYMRRQDYLFLGRRTLRKIIQIVRESMDPCGAQELQTSGPKAIANIAQELRSPKQLPQIWYQFHESRCECYTFGDVEISPRPILDRCGIQYQCGVDALFTLTENGPDQIAKAETYAATLETAASVASTPPIDDPNGDLAPEQFHTPDQKSIADIAAFTSLPETSQMKTLVLVADRKPVMAILRGDHQLSETKLKRHCQAFELRPARPDEIREWLGADAGSLGPVGVTKMRIVADEALRGRRNMICGANRTDYHLRNVTPGEDFEPEFADLRQASGNELSPDGTPLSIHPGRVIARNRPNGWDLYLDAILTTAVEQNRDADGLRLPPAIAPFQAVITPISKDQLDLSFELYNALRANAIDAVIDDRDERPGVKFKDADLTGIPYRINIGRTSADGVFELVDRRSRQATEIPAKDAAEIVAREITLTIDWTAVRAEFPALENWTYLNTATYGQLPKRAIEANARHFANREEMACSDFLNWYDEADRIRTPIGKLIGAAAEDIAFVPNSSYALGLVAAGVDWQRGDNVVTLADEFPNCLYLPALVERHGVEFREVPWDRFYDAIDERTRLVAISEVNYSNGFRAPVAEISRHVHQLGGRLFVDGTQSVGALRFDVAQAQPDVLAVHAYKWMISPTGIGFMYVSPDFRKTLRPNVAGWRTHKDWRNVDNLHHGMPEMTQSAEKYEGGGLAFGLLDAMGAVAGWMLELSPCAIEARVMELAASARERLRNLGADVPDRGSQIVAARFDGLDPSRLAKELKASKVLVAARHGHLRISPHFYNNESDLDVLESHLLRLCQR
jgi:prolyl-tRNA synthetase